MDRIRQHETQITVCGMVCNVEVTYEVEDWGSLSRAPAFFCTSVVDVDTGHNWTRYCEETRPAFTVQQLPEWGLASSDRIQRAIFGTLQPMYGSPGVYGFGHMGVGLHVVGSTVMDLLHAEIADEPFWNEDPFADAHAAAGGW